MRSGKNTQTFEFPRKNLWKFIQRRFLFSTLQHCVGKHERRNVSSCCSEESGNGRGLRYSMLNSTLMVINELLNEKSLITHIIFRLIFFRFSFGASWEKTSAGNVRVSVCK